ncbi:MAG: tetratricopeptide repeat protein [Candidatus Omnitrophica bacterium]|nr:tetratricopeptide repeat protein [Candidatus Omnitrophota bacterium]
MTNKKKYIWLFLGILILSFSIRIIYLDQIKSTPVFGFYSADSQYHDKFAREILEGNLAFKDTIYVNPYYSFILALIYKLFGHSVIAVGLCQIIIDTVTGIFLYLICVKIFNKKAIGLLAFFIYACYGISIFYTAFILEAAISGFLLTGFVMGLLYAESSEKKGLWILSGFLLGLFVLLRANAILLVPFLLFWLYTRKNKKVLQGTISLVFIIAGLLIAVSPFAIRNYIISKHLSPFPANGGINFYMGNHPGATGAYTTLKGISNAPISQVKQSIEMARTETGKNLDPYEASGYWFQKGLRFIKDNPYQYSLLIFKKLRLFLNKAEIAVNENFNFCKKFVPALRFPLFTFGIMAPFAVTGLVFAARRRDEALQLIILFIVGYAVSVILFFVGSRYRFAIVPLLIIMSAYAVHEFFILIKNSNYLKFLSYFAVLIISFLIINSGAPVAASLDNLCMNYNNLGVSYYEKGAIAEAVDEYKKAIEIDPAYAESYNNLAGAYYRLGENEKSIILYRKAISLSPNFTEAYYGLGNVYAEIADTENAIDCYRKAIELDPDLIEAYNNLGFVYGNVGREKEAENIFKNILKIDPKYIKAYNNLGIIYAKTGRINEAITLFKKALEIDPNYSDAYNNLLRAHKAKRNG